MNKGDAFELEVKERLEYELANGNFGICLDCAKVVHRKRYFSQQRQKYIVMDVIIEIYRPNSDKPYLDWIWECKNYEKQVPIDDLEEFHAKLEQIGLHSRKGTVVCRNGFQESAISYAENMGIGLVRILPDGSLLRMQEAVRDDTISSDFVKYSLAQKPDEVFFNSSFFALSCSGRGTKSLKSLIYEEMRNVL